MQALSSPFWASFIKSSSSCRDWDWVCVRIFQDRSKTTETKRSAQTPARPLRPLGSLQGPLEGGWSLTQARHRLPGHFSELLACLVALTLTPVSTPLLQELLSAKRYAFHLFLPCHFIKKFLVKQRCQLITECQTGGGDIFPKRCIFKYCCFYIDITTSKPYTGCWKSELRSNLNS